MSYTTGQKVIFARNDKVKSTVGNFVDRISDLFFPKRCLGCGAVGSFICPVCLLTVAVCETQVCPQCCRPSIGGFVHALCCRPRGAERLVCLFKFEGVIAVAIKALKYGAVRQLSPCLMTLAGPVLEEFNISLGRQSLILPVPLHPLKRLERGFNQTELLATDLGSRLGLTVRSDILEKGKETVSQTKLRAPERAANVQGVFGLAPKAQEQRNLIDQDVVIVDDVWTSGATLRECARVVKEGGARFVYLLTLAKD